MVIVLTTVLGIIGLVVRCAVVGIAIIGWIVIVKFVIKEKIGHIGIVLVCTSWD